MEIVEGGTDGERRKEGSLPTILSSCRVCGPTSSSQLNFYRIYPHEKCARNYHGVRNGVILGWTK